MTLLPGGYNPAPGIELVDYLKKALVFFPHHLLFQQHTDPVMVFRPFGFRYEGIGGLMQLIVGKFKLAVQNLFTGRIHQFFHTRIPIAFNACLPDRHNQSLGHGLPKCRRHFFPGGLARNSKGSQVELAADGRRHGNYGQGFLIQALQFSRQQVHHIIGNHAAAYSG